MNWVILMLVIGGALALGRIALSVRQLSKQKVDDWDSRLIERMRRGGSDPFAAYDVDFFLALPSEAVAQRIAGRLATEGFQVDIKPVADSDAHPFSVHAMRSMQLTVDGIREVSARLRSIAAETGGRYDGWAAGKASSVT